MALSHILAAITAEADTQIAALASQHGTRMAEASAAHERALSELCATIQRHKNERMQQLRKRARDHMDMMRRHAILARKQEILDGFYASLVDAFASLPAEETERLLRSWIERLPAGGTILPSKAHEELLRTMVNGRTMGAPISAKGGFRFESDREDRDYTYESLVTNVVRPDTEIDVARQLFKDA